MLTRKNTVNGRSFLFVWAWSFHNFSFMDTEIPHKRHFNVKFQWNEEFLFHKFEFCSAFVCG
jgi:hypothetical protein